MTVIQEPTEEWADYATRAGLLVDGVAPDPRKTQTAWFAFTAAWNQCSKSCSAEFERMDKENYKHRQDCNELRFTLNQLEAIIAATLRKIG